MTVAAHKQQRGVALLLLMLVLLVSGSSLLLAAISTGSLDRQQRDDINRDLAKAKEALLAYAIHADAQSPGNTPGQFPCPVDAEGTADCLSTGRLPLDNALFHLIDRDIRYRVASGFTVGSSNPLNTLSEADLALNGESGHVAILSVPDPTDALRDIQLGITCRELQTFLVPRVIKAFRTLLADNETLPADGATFQTLVAAEAPAWLLDNQWTDTGVSLYTLVDPAMGEVLITLSTGDDCAPPQADYELVINQDEDA